MDLAFPDGVWVSGIRIKLHFEDPHILSPQQVHDGFLNSWFGVRPHLQCVADLASDIASCFQLSQTCPHGISLRMEKFTLPPPQPVWLLKDKDIVSVKKKNDLLPSAMRDFKWVNSLSPDKKGPIADEVCTVEELKVKAGDCNSEKGGSALESPNQLTDFVNVLPKTVPTTEPKHKKKRKRSEHEGVDEQEQHRELQLVPYTREDNGEKVKGLKKKKPTLHQDIKDDKFLKQDGVQKCKRRKSVNSNVAEETRKEKKITQLESRKNKKNEQNEMVIPSVKNNAGQQCGQQFSDLSTSHSLNDGKVMSQEKKPMTEAESEFKKKPSRSTLRKKAKRRWKREHPESLEETKGQKPLGLPKDLACTKNRKADSALQGFPACPNINEDDGEAEEEKLPIVVRPGHIRFVHDDEGEEINVAQHSELKQYRLNLNNVISKRQGQSWGQEKVQGRRIGKKFKETVLADSGDVCGEIVFDSLPCLKIKPQVGDILAYRVVELTTSMCPELSEYRVGKVSEFETQSEMLKLIPLPNYPPFKRTLEDLAQEESCDMSFPSLYNEDGSLETQLVSLVDVRLVRATMNVTEAPLDSQIQALNVMAKTDMRENDPAEATVQRSDVVDGQDALDPARKGLISNSKTPMICSPTVNNTSTTCHPELIGKALSNDLASAWQDLSDMLDKRKDELSRLEAVTVTLQPNGSPSFNEEKTQRGCTSGAKSQNGKTDFQNKSRSFRPRRAGALGPTMALLRAQNDL